MTSYLLGLCLLVAMVVPPAWGARRVRRRIVPGWEGAPAWVVDIVVWAATVIVVPEVLGAFGLFRRFVVAAVLALVGGVGGWLAGTVSSSGAPDVAPAPMGETVVAGAISLLFAFPWAAAVWANFRFGTLTYDSLNYHLPFAARWVQTGSMWHIHQINPDSIIAYHPASAEVLHGLGMLAFKSDLVSPLINLIWLALLGVSAWSIGRPFGRAPHCLALALVAADSPIMLLTQPGSALTDLALVATCVAAVALLVQAVTPPLAALAGAAPAGAAAGAGTSATSLRSVAIPFGLALGLAAGIKLDGLAPVAVIFVGAVILAPRPDRPAVAVRALAAALGAGGFFYLRDLVAVHNPIPALGGPLPQVKAPFDQTYGFSVAHYLTNGKVIRTFFVPGLHFGYGRLWPLYLVMVAAGTVAIIVRAPTAALRVAGAAAAATVIVYLVTPTGAFGLPGDPVLFRYNTRYAIVGFVLGAILLAVVPGPRWWGRAVLAVGAAVGTSSVASHISWPAGVDDAIGWKATSVLIVAALMAVGWLVVRRRHLLRVVGGLAAAASVVAGYGVQTHVVPHHFTEINAFSPALAWSHRLHHARIGTFDLGQQYPLYNTDLSNVVQAVGSYGLPHHQFAFPTTCAAFRSTVNAAHYDYVVFSPDYAKAVLPSQEAWMRGAEGSVEVFRSSGAAVYRIDHPLDPHTC